MECANRVVDLGDLVVDAILISELDPPDQEWDHAQHAVVQYLHRHDVPVARLRVLTITQGGSPTTRQRAGA